MFKRSGPIVNRSYRTRRREDLFLKEQYEKIKKQRKIEQGKERNVGETKKGKYVGLRGIEEEDIVDVGSDFDVEFIGEFNGSEPVRADVGETRGKTRRNRAGKSVESERGQSLTLGVESDDEVVFVGEDGCSEAKRDGECISRVSDEQNNFNGKVFRQSGDLYIDRGKKKSEHKVVPVYDVDLSEDDASTEESSQKDNDDSDDDDDYRVESSQTSDIPGESGSSCSDEDEETFAARKVEARRSGRKASKGTFDFLDVLTNSILDKGSEALEEEVVTFTDACPRNLESKKASNPHKFTFGVKAAPEKSEHEKEVDKLWVEMDYSTSDANSDDGNAAEVGSKNCSEGIDGSSKKCSKVELKSATKVNFLDVLANSLLDNGEVPTAELVPLTDIPPYTKSKKAPLLLKFTFGAEKAQEAKKSEYEKELDKLWVDLDFELRSSEIGVADINMVDCRDATCKKAEKDDLVQCQQGYHELILNEEVGILCKYCPFVQTEIRYVTSPFLKDQPVRSGERYYGGGDFSAFDDLCSEIPDQSGSSLYTQTEGTVWENIPGVISTLYPHQREGFEFIWKNIAGGIHRDKAKNQSEGGRGCIISHAPGTGKTRLVIVFIQSYMKENRHCRPLIVAPRSMLLTWEEEFKKWGVDIPFYNLNKPELTGNETPVCISSLEKYKGEIRDMEMARRLVKLYSWKCDSSILGISYGLFKQLAGRYKIKDDNALSEKISRILLEIPELVVLDEGHTPRNEESQIWKVLTEIKTEKRIILSGTPFQNNFDELFNTLSLVRPKFAESLHCGHQQSVGPKRGKKKDEGKQRWMSLTSSIAHNKSQDKELKQLKEMIKPFVHVHKGAILDRLPGLRRYMVVLRPTELQKKLLDVLQEEKQFFLLEYCVSLISVHPCLLDSCSDKGIGRERIEMLKLLAEKDLESTSKLDPNLGVKTRFLLELIQLSEALNEKVIVFSQYIDPLNLIKDQLEARLGWKEGSELLYMDGKRDVKQRQSSINAFNDFRSKAKVLLASIRACSEGINLVGGSRVVLLDVTWNPSVEKQAISRAYRLGQSKIVYIYHLILSGSIDENKYCKQAEKGIIAEKVFSNSDSNKEGQRNNFYNVLEDRILEMLFHDHNFNPIFEKISQPGELADDGNGDWILADNGD